MQADAGHFRQDDDGRLTAGRPDGTADTLNRDVAHGEVVERIVAIQRLVD